MSFRHLIFSTFLPIFATAPQPSNWVIGDTRANTVGIEIQ
jgi:hypothetical protein